MSESLLRNLIRDRKAPDILTCIANLSSDEVFTPPELVDKVLDLLPEEVWHDKDLRWLDPACKTGIFLRQIALRLMVGLRDEFPDETERRRHIFQNMLFGIAITDLTALMSRRSLYTSKNANSEKSVADFADMNGNIDYENRKHDYRNGNCIYCGNREGGELDRDDSKERHAYKFIHLTEEEAKKMKFDVIVGNPPYQLNSGGHGAQATPIYHFFIEQAKKLNPRYMAFIIPSRWFAGGMGLNKFREAMLRDRHLVELYDYPDASDCFPGVEIKGGVNYFVWDSQHDGECRIHTIVKNEEISVQSRYLDEYDIFIRWNQAVPILRKVQAKHEQTLNNSMSGLDPFRLPTNFTNFDNVNNPDKIKIYANKKTGFIKSTLVGRGQEYINQCKVLLAKAAEGGGDLPNMVIGKPIIAESPSCCTMTYFIAGTYTNIMDAENFTNYLKTRFVRFLVLLRKNTQDVNKEKFAFVPDLPMNQEWTDKKLYERYELTDDEIKFIESMIKEMK